MRTSGLWALMMVGVVACGDRQPAPTEPVSADLDQQLHAISRNEARRQLLAADAAHSAASAARGKAGFLATLTPDALFLLPISPLAHGKAEARALLDAPPAPFAPAMKLSWTPVFSEVSVDGKVGYTFGNVRIADAAAPGLLGQYIAFWRRQNDGDWKVEAWSFSGAGAEPGTPPDFEHYPGRASSHPVSVARENRELLDTDAAFAQASLDIGQARAFRRYADQHAVVLAGGDPDFLIGRQAIYESRQGATSELSWTPLFAGVGRFGDLGFTVGSFQNVLPTGTRFGKYLTIWRKQKSGNWRFVQDGGSSSPPPAQ